MASTSEIDAAVEFRRGWRLVLLGSLISSLGSGLTFPFLIVYLHGVRHLALPAAGLIVAASGVAALGMGTASGTLGDRIGFGRVLVLGLAIGGAGTALLAFATGPLTAVVSVAMIGTGSAMEWPALNSIVASQLPATKRPRAYALRFGVINAGMGVGGLISGFVVVISRPFTFQAIYLADAATTLVFAAIVLGGLRGTAGYSSIADPAVAVCAHGHRRGEIDGEAGKPGTAPVTRGYAAVLGDRRFVAYLSCLLLFMIFGYAQLDGPWAQFATGVAGAPPRIVGIAFGLNTFVIVAAQLWVAHATRRVRRTRILLAVAGFWALGWLITGLADLPGAPPLVVDILLVASLGVFAIGEMLFSPLNGALPNDLSPDDLRGRYNALSSTVWAVGGLIGPPIAGLLLGSPAPIAWVIVVAAGMLAAALGGMRLGRHLPDEINSPPLDEPVLEPGLRASRSDAVNV